MALQESAEGRRLLLAAFDAAQDDLVVVGEVGVHLDPGAELDEDVAQTGVLGVPVSQSVLQVFCQLSASVHERGNWYSE